MVGKGYFVIAEEVVVRFFSVYWCEWVYGYLEKEGYFVFRFIRVSCS